MATTHRTSSSSSSSRMMAPPTPATRGTSRGFVGTGAKLMVEVGVAVTGIAGVII